MDSRTFEATAVVRKNSISFIEQLFALARDRRPVVMVNDAAQASALAGITIDRCITPDDQTGWFVAHHPLIHDDLPAQVSYTSGTEGKPKGILLTYANLADAAQRIIDEMQMTDEIREYVGIPATFSFGMGRFRAISAVGGQAYLPPRGFDPLELARMLAAGQVNALSAVPTLLRILLDEPDLIGEAGKALRWMEIGSQHMTADEKLGIRRMFPNALIVQHYGLTEASRTTFLRVSEVPEDLLESVGRPVGRTEVELGPDSRIRIRGPHVAAARVDADGLHDLRDAQGWLQTNDLGHRQGGYLFFDGRADDLINIGGVKVAPDQLEQAIRAWLQPGAQIAVAKVPDTQRGEGVLVAIQSGTGDLAKAKDLAIAALQKMGVVAGSALHVVAVDAIPVTGTGKVQRKALAEQFVAQQAAAPAVKKVTKDEITDVLSLFRYEFPGRPVGPNDTFETLGGDSLHYIQFSLGFERHFGHLPDHWESLSVAELQGMIGTTEKTTWRRLEPSTALRAFFMICIIALHTEAFQYSSNFGAAYFLVLLAGYSLGRFQLPEVIRTGSTRTVWGTIKYVAIPTILMVAFLQLATQRFEIMPLLLLSNYLDPYTLRGFSMYFVEFYIQTLVLAALFFSIPKVQQAFKLQPMVSGLALLVTVTVLDLIIEHFWNGDYDFHRTPWNYAWPFSLGILLAVAKDRRSQLVALATAVVAFYLKFGISPAFAYLAGGYAIMVFVRAFVVPAPVKRVVSEIAGASLFIYLTHEVMMSVVNKIFGGHRPWIALISAICVGIMAAHVWAWISRKFIHTVDGMQVGERG